MESTEIKMKWEFEMILKLNERIKSDQEWILKTPQKNMKRKRNPYIPVLDIYIHQFNQLSTPLKCLGRFTKSLPQPEYHLGNLAGTWWVYTPKVCLKSWKVWFFGHPKCCTGKRSARDGVQKVVRSALPRVTPMAPIQTQETIDVCHSHKIKLESLNMTLWYVMIVS